MKFLRHHTQHSAKYLHVIIFLTVLLNSQSSLAIESRKIEKLIEDTQPPDKKAVLLQESQKILKEGRKYYFKFCVHCHGKKGAGDGTASYHLFPQPRELSQGIYKFHTTRTNTLPLNKDLIHTIKKGIPGTAMPAWEKVLSEETIQSIVEFIKTFSNRLTILNLNR